MSASEATGVAPRAECGEPSRHDPGLQTECDRCDGLICRVAGVSLRRRRHSRAREDNAWGTLPESRGRNSVRRANLLLTSAKPARVTQTASVSKRAVTAISTRCFILSAQTLHHGAGIFGFAFADRVKAATNSFNRFFAVDAPQQSSIGGNVQGHELGSAIHGQDHGLARPPHLPQQPRCVSLEFRQGLGVVPKVDCHGIVQCRICI